MSFLLLTPLYMTTAQRLLSLSLMGGLTLAVAPLAGAQGPFGDLDDTDRQAVRTALEACRDNNEEREDRKACADAVFAQYGIEKPEGHGRRGQRRGQHDGQKQDIPEDVREDLKACREDNAGDHEAAKTCAEEVFNENGLEMPEHRGRGQKIGHKFRSNIVETCGERENTDEWRACTKEARGTIRGEFQEEHPKAFNRFQNRRRRGGIHTSADLRAELRTCLEIDDNEELRECVFGVREAAREQSQN
jgi:hypothetical protein